jgi:hypothetical protein
MPFFQPFSRSCPDSCVRLAGAKNKKRKEKKKKKES